MAGIKCPNCGLLNPESAEKCDCGYLFKRQGNPKPSTLGGTATEHTITVHPRVSVVDVNMPFGSMVVFMVKWAIASIPALIILFILGLIAAALFGGAFATLGRLAK